MRALGLGWSGIYIASEVSNTGRVQSRQTPGSSGCDPNLGFVRFVSDLFKGETRDLHGDLASSLAVSMETDENDQDVTPSKGQMKWIQWMTKFIKCIGE